MSGNVPLRTFLSVLYPRCCDEALIRVEKVCAELGLRRGNRAPASEFFSHKDAVLITYADTLRAEGEAPLQTLGAFAGEYLTGAFSIIHLLPFFPYSSDDGFSVKDYLSVEPSLGTWEHVQHIAERFRLMVDFVLNHISSKSQWFAQYLRAEEGFRDLAIEVDPSQDLSSVARPRTSPLLTPFKKEDGSTVYLWTTFSADQVDLNWRSLDVFEKMLRVLLTYVRRGASLLRLDAVAYLWKEVGTPCIHLPQVHALVQFFRALLDEVAPGVALVTETNVPHNENTRYFGDGTNEAQLVYNFTLPPLLLYTFVEGDSTAFLQWAATLRTPSTTAAFLNFTASHDGIGLRPLEGVLPGAIPALCRLSAKSGGLVSYRLNPDGSKSPYELNVTYVDAILGASGCTRSEPFIASQAVALALPGVPAVYIHSLLGSRNWTEGVRKTGQSRAINREKLNLHTLKADLARADCFRSQVFRSLLRLLKVRRAQPAFDPGSACRVLQNDKRFVVIHRSGGGQELYAVVNVTGRALRFRLSEPRLPPQLFEIIEERRFYPGSEVIPPYGVRWVTH